jgi:dolichyl-phosphate-mannose-protein mannosyltransferase
VRRTSSPDVISSLVTDLFAHLRFVGSDEMTTSDALRPAIPAEPAPGAGWSGRVLRAIWIVGAAILAMALVAATIRLVGLAPSVASAARHEPAIAAAFVVIVAVVLVALASALIAERRQRWVLALALGFAVLLGARLAAVAIFPTPLVSDWAAYFHLANGILDGEGFWSSRATGYPAILAAALAVAGRSPSTGEILNIVVAVLVGALLVILVEPRFGRRAALLALFAYAAIPSQVLYSVLLSTETVYAGAIVLLAILAIRSIDGHPGWAVVLGAAFGVAQYIRPTSQFLLPAALLLLFLYGIRARQALKRSALAVLAFALVTAPIVAWNVTENHRLSVAPYLFDGWILYAGLNVEADGRYTRVDDQRVLEAMGERPGPGPDTFDPTALNVQRRWNDTAYRLALQRLEGNGIRTLLMQPAKFGVLWGRAGQAAKWIFYAPADDAARRTRNLLSGLAQVGWVVILFGALAAVASRLGAARGPDRAPECSIVILFLIATSVVNTAAQADDRFHEYFVPLLCAVAAVGWLDVVGRPQDLPLISRGWWSARRDRTGRRLAAIAPRPRARQAGLR